MGQEKQAAHKATKVSRATKARPVPPHLEKMDDSAFLHRMHSCDSFAEQLGEGFVRTAISGEDDGEDLRDAIDLEDLGALRVETPSAPEIDLSLDASNSMGRDPFPRI